MRKPLLSLASVALVLAACGSSASSNGGAAAQPPPPAHHQPTYPPPAPAASAYGGVTYQDPGTNPVTDPTEDRVSTFAMDVDTASYAIAQRYVADGNTPDPASVRTEEWVNAFDQGYPAPDDATFGIHIDGAPSPFLASRDVLLRVGIQARDSSERQPAGGRADVRHRHLRLDGPRGPARAGQGLAPPAGPRSRARRFDRRRHLRRRRARRAAADQGDRRRPDPVRHRRAPAEWLDQPRGGPHARLPAGARDPARRRRHRPGDPGLGRRRERRADRRRRHPRTGSGTTPRPASSWCRSGSGWATTTTPCSSSWPTRATASTPTSTTGRRPASCSSTTSSRRSRPSRSTPRCRSSSIPPWSRRTGSSDTRTGPSPTATSAIRASTPAPSGPATRSPPSTTSRSARGSPATRSSGRSGCAGRSPGPATSPRSGARSGPATWRRGSRRPTRPSGSTRSWPPRPRRCAQGRGSDGPDLRTILDVAHEDGGLPATDQVHDFVRFLERTDELGG